MCFRCDKLKQCFDAIFHVAMRDMYIIICMYSLFYFLIIALLQVTGTYSCKRMTAHWPMVVFFNILDVSAYNMFVVWMEVNPGWKQGKFFKRRPFLEELGKAMVPPLIQRRQHLPQTPSSAGLMRAIRGAEARSTAARDRRKRCNLCAPRYVKTSITCYECSAYICKAHATTTMYCPKCV